MWRHSEERVCGDMDRRTESPGENQGDCGEMDNQKGQNRGIWPAQLVKHLVETFGHRAVSSSPTWV